MSYNDGVYHVIPLVVSHPGEATKKGDTIITSSSPLVSEVSQQQRMVLTTEVDEEDEEDLIRPHLRRPQTAAKSSASGVLVDDQTSQPAGVSSNPKVASSATPVRHSVSVLEPRHTPCLLKGLGSAITYIELNELHHCFHIPHSISIRVPEIGELPL